MQAAHRHTPSVPAWLVCDVDALRAYGIGMVRPGGRGLAPYLADAIRPRPPHWKRWRADFGMDAACAGSQRGAKQRQRAGRH